MLVPMKKAALIILKDDKTAVLEAIQRGGQLMIIEPESGENLSSGVSEKDRVDREQAQAMLRLIDTVKTKKPFFVDRPQIDYEAFMKPNKAGEEVVVNTNDVSEEIQAVHTTIQTSSLLCEHLEPWLELDSPTSALKSDQYVTVKTGFIPSNAVDEVIAAIEPYPAKLQTYANAPEGIATVLVAYSKDADAAVDAAKQSGFNETTLPETDLPPREIYDQQQQIIKQSQEELVRLNEKLASLAGSRDELELLIQQMNSKQAREEVPYSGTVETVSLVGWVREDRTEDLERDVRSVTEVYDLSFTDPAEGEIPPTVTQNPEFLASFETITDMFSLPKAGSIDPAPIAGPWYWVIFGMMIGDVGYGVLSVIAFWLFRKIKDPRGEFRKLINVLYYSSYMSILWGVLFGSYFGETWHPILFSPMDDPMTMLIFTLGVGILHVFTGMGMQIAENIKAGKWLDAIFDQVSWMMLLGGLCMLFLPQTSGIGKWIAIAGALIILLTAGRDSKNIFGKVSGGLLGLYNITSYLSDILSYSRILALALATSVVAFVMNMLAGMVAHGIIGIIAAVLILIVGHVFNIAMSTLSAYVHDSRLEYIEFFNQFYEGGGKKFTPLAVSEEYYDVKRADHPQDSNSVGPEHLNVQS